MSGRVLTKINTRLMSKMFMLPEHTRFVDFYWDPVDGNDVFCAVIEGESWPSTRDLDPLPMVRLVYEQRGDVLSFKEIAAMPPPSNDEVET